MKRDRGAARPPGTAAGGGETARRIAAPTIPFYFLEEAQFFVAVKVPLSWAFGSTPWVSVPSFTQKS